MADQEQLKLLKRSVPEWNQWRKYWVVRPDLSGAVLRSAYLNSADLMGAHLSGAYLMDADLTRADLSGAVLRDADFSGVRILDTVFANVDLSGVKGLEMVDHGGPSTTGIDTIYRSRGEIPEVFLRGAGVPDSFLEYMRALVGKPIEYYSCFIAS